MTGSKHVASSKHVHYLVNIPMMGWWHVEFIMGLVGKRKSHIMSPFLARLPAYPPVPVILSSCRESRRAPVCAQVLWGTMLPCCCAQSSPFHGDLPKLHLPIAAVYLILGGFYVMTHWGVLQSREPPPVYLQIELLNDHIDVILCCDWESDPPWILEREN